MRVWRKMCKAAAGIGACLLLAAESVSAQEVVINSLVQETWENRPLIQATDDRDEYLGAVALQAFVMPFCQDSSAQQLYQTVRKGVVRITAGQAAGSGLIWRMEEGGMVIAANRHLLEGTMEGTVILWNQESLPAQVLGISAQYDVGFLWIEAETIPIWLLPQLYEVRGTMGQEVIAEQYVMQVGSARTAAQDWYEGVGLDSVYLPEFQTQMLQTDCYAKAGMSGGGVFNERGELLGMIAGGALKEDTVVRESEITYSIPVSLIQECYETLRE